MQQVWLFDVLLIVMLISYAVYGFRSGFVHSLSAIVGVVVGAIAAFLVIPFVGGWVSDSSWRAAATLAIALGFILAGHSAGTAIGHALRRRVDKAKLRLPDRMLGAVLSGITAALVASMLAVSLAPLGVPFLSQAIASSSVLRTIDTVTPPPVRTLLAQVRSIAVNEGLPLITEAIGGITTAPQLPDVDTDNPALAAAARSVVRISGNAPACGQTQLGSGFVVAADRVVTNAHVVAGVADPLVETLDGTVHQGSIVFFDPVDDLAVIAVSDLPTPPLQRGTTVAEDTVGVVNGYPFGGPFTSGAAEVLSVDTVNIANIYGQEPSPREVYTLAASVNEGGSGGPILAESGAVVGVVFAKSATVANLGYAMTMAELAPVADQAPLLTSAVQPGACVRG